MCDKEQLKWHILYRKMAENKIPYKSDLYRIDDYVTDNEIKAESSKVNAVEPSTQLISPTHQQVEQAKAELKRKLKEYPQRKRKIVCFWEESHHNAWDIVLFVTLNLVFKLLMCKVFEKELKNPATVAYWIDKW